MAPVRSPENGDPCERFSAPGGNDVLDEEASRLSTSYHDHSLQATKAPIGSFSQDTNGKGRGVTATNGTYSRALLHPVAFLKNNLPARVYRWRRGQVKESPVAEPECSVFRKTRKWRGQKPVRSSACGWLALEVATQLPSPALCHGAAPCVYLKPHRQLPRQSNAGTEKEAATLTGLQTTSLESLTSQASKPGVP